MQEQLAKKSCSLEQYELQIEELVEKELNVFMAMFTEQVKVKESDHNRRLYHGGCRKSHREET